jgi:hypothetical protein
MNVADNRKFLKALLESLEEAGQGAVAAGAAASAGRPRGSGGGGNSAPPDASGGSSSGSGFDAIVETARRFTFRRPPRNKKPRPRFDAAAWDQKGDGGLTDRDREMLGRIYGAADSVFEYGLGESTRIAARVGVPAYAGIDSDPNYVADTRARVPSHFRFYFGDIGKTRMWGFPTQNLTKAVWDYQLAPLLAEPHPFDVYMVDGRYRFPLLLASFLHAEARGEANLTRTVVLVHDCWRPPYHRADPHLELFERTTDTEAGEEADHLCAYRRRPDTRSEDLVALWRQTFVDWE